MFTGALNTAEMITLYTLLSYTERVSGAGRKSGERSGEQIFHKTPERSVECGREAAEQERAKSGLNRPLKVHYNTFRWFSDILS